MRLTRRPALSGPHSRAWARRRHRPSDQRSSPAPPRRPCCFAPPHRPAVRFGAPVFAARRPPAAGTRARRALSLSLSLSALSPAALSLSPSPQPLPARAPPLSGPARACRAQRTDGRVRPRAHRPPPPAAQAGRRRSLRCRRRGRGSRRGREAGYGEGRNAARRSADLGEGGAGTR